MGNIRQTHIKRIARELVHKFNDHFSSNFDDNKKILEEITNINGKKMRNRIAGYITKYWVRYNKNE